MSRSYRKLFLKLSNTNKLCKKAANKRFRKFLKTKLRNEEYYMKHKIREVSDTWNFNSDGPAFYVDMSGWKENGKYKVLRK